MEKSYFRIENGESSFRYHTKCLFNDTGFCKFGEQCRKLHHKNICLILNCDRNCNSRHPKPCKFKAKCKFFSKQMCAYKHVTFASDDMELEALKKEVECLRLENERKQLDLDKLHDEISNSSAKEESSHQNIEVNELRENIKNLKAENLQLKNEVKIKDLELKDKVANEAEIQNENIQLKNDIDLCLRENEELKKTVAVKQIKWDSCEFQAKSSSGLKTHKTAKHQNSNRLNQEPIDYKCSKCSENFKSKDDLNEHDALQHGPKSSFKMTFSCDKC